MRQISTTFRDVLEARGSGTFPVIFLAIGHPELHQGFVRLVNDVVDFVWQGETWVGFPFSFELLSDDESPPTAKLRVQNVDRRLGEIVQAIPSAPTLEASILSSADFSDYNGTARVEIGTPVPEYVASNMKLRNIRVDAQIIEGELMTYDPTAEPYPSTRSTRDRMPGLFR